MFPSAGDELRVKPGGIVIAVVAFVLTRTLLVGIVYGDSGASTVENALRLGPLIIGLGIVIYGVNLAVSTRDREYARTVAIWYLIGSIGIFGMVALGTIESAELIATLSSDPITANAVIGGGVGGIIVGIRSGRDRRHRRSLARQSEQLVLLNRLLRHEILNALTAVRGHAELVGTDRITDRSSEAITNGVDRIEAVVDRIGFLVRSVDEAPRSLTSVDLASVIRESTSDVSEDTAVSIKIPSGVQVRANEHLEKVVSGLIRIARERAEDADVSLTVDPKDTTVDIRLRSDELWLSEADREVLLEGLPEHDDPNIDFEIPMIRLLVAQYGGSIDIVEERAGTTLVLTLLRTSEEATESNRPGVERANLRNAALAGVIAGVFMGAVLQGVSGEMGVIGGLYGVQTPILGWITHLFHSVVFATIFVAALTVDRLEDYASGVGGCITMGVLFGLILWLIAGGVIMGVWLNLVGIPSGVPRLGVVSFIGHAVWGALVGTLVFVLPD